MARAVGPQRATPPLLKDLNERTVLDTIRADGPISRAEISRRAGISKPTVSLALQSLLDAGLVREAAHDPDGPSYGALFFEPVPDAALVLGLDLGTRFLRGAICDLTGTVLVRRDVRTDTRSEKQALEAIAALRLELIEITGLADELIDCAVVGVPGVVEDASGSGTVRLANIEALEGRPFGAALQEILELPVTLDNDINLAALGEQWRGVARGVEDFVFLSVGGGLGAGLVLNGELHRGRNGAAGEMDFVEAGIGDDINPCPDGIALVAASVVKRSRRKTALTAPFDAPDVFAAARDGDALALKVVAEVARRISVHLSAVAAVADVELAVLGGGVGVNGDLLLEPVRERVAQLLSYPPQIEVTSLGDGAILTGALAVGLERARENVFVNRSNRSSEMTG